MTNRIIVAGTDTDVGKTVFAAGLTQLLNADYWKPVQSGRAPSTDSETVAALTGLTDDRILPERYVFEMPASPHTAAAAEARAVDIDTLQPPSRDRLLIIETAGGLLVPLTDRVLQIDVMVRWKAPVILCARTSLGTINHSLLSIEALKARAIPITGIAFIGDENVATETTICRLGRVRRLGRLPRLDPLDRSSLGTAMRDHFNRASLLGLQEAGP